MVVANLFVKHGNETITHLYPLVNKDSYGKSPLLIGKSIITGPFSIAMLHDQMVVDPSPNRGPATAGAVRLRTGRSSMMRGRPWSC